MPQFIEMESGGTEAFLGGMDGMAADLRIAWDNAVGRISAGEAGIGRDRLAAAFAPPYRASADPTRAAGGDLPEHYSGMCASGRSCVAAYLAADRRVAGMFPQTAAL
jgi:hypothetical protein